MFRSVSKLISGSLFLMLSTSLTAQAVDVNKAIVITQKQSLITLSLPANPTTGFSWILEGNYNAALIKPVAEKYQPEKTGLVGSGGTDRWTFKIQDLAFTVPTHIRLQLVYTRTWGKGQSKPKTVDIYTVNS